MKVTEDELVKLLRKKDKAAQPSKYRNVKCLVDGIQFDSKREARVWLDLKTRQASGEITELLRQIHFPLYCPCIVKADEGDNWEYLRVAEYVADFTYKDAQRRLHVVDAKGRRVCPYPLKKKWLELQNSIIIEEV